MVYAFLRTHEQPLRTIDVESRKRIKSVSLYLTCLQITSACANRVNSYLAPVSRIHVE